MIKSELIENILGGWTAYSQENKKVFANEISTACEGMSHTQIHSCWNEIKMMDSKPSLPDILKVIYNIKNPVKEKTYFKAEPDFDYANKFMINHKIYSRDYGDEINGYIYRRVIEIARSQIDRGNEPFVEFNETLIARCLKDKEEIDKKKQYFKENGKPYPKFDFNNSGVPF